MNLHRKTLPFSEKTILWILLCVIGSVFFSSVISSLKFKELHISYKKIEPIFIRIEGAIKHPGNYSVFPGISLEEFFKKVSLKVDSDLKNFDLKTRLYESQSLFVPRLEFITVYVDGAILGPVKLTLKPGTRRCSLCKLITFKENADIAPLKSKKKLRDQENIHIYYLQDNS